VYKLSIIIKSRFLYNPEGGLHPQIHVWLYEDLWPHSMGEIMRKTISKEASLPIEGYCYGIHTVMVFMCQMYSITFGKCSSEVAILNRGADLSYLLEEISITLYLLYWWLCRAPMESTFIKIWCFAIERGISVFLRSLHILINNRNIFIWYIAKEIMDNLRLM